MDKSIYHSNTYYGYMEPTINQVNQDILLVQGTRVLRPSEWEKLRNGMLTDYQRGLVRGYISAGDVAKSAQMERYQIVCDMLMHTGMRIVEAKELKPEWYRPARRVIVIPKSAIRKKKCLYTERTVMLSLPGCDAVDRYLKSGLAWPTNKSGFRAALIRYAIKAGISPTGITTKMFRKTIVSWLMACYPERALYVAASMGHDIPTLQKHYLGLGWERAEVEKMREYLKEWGVLA